MQDRNAQILRCAWPGCWDRIWMDRRLEVCETHANEVFNAMGSEIHERVKARAAQHRETQLWHLERQVAALKAQLAAAEVVKAKTERAKAQGPKVGTIYYLRSGANIKIGWTGDLRQRMRGYPPDTTILATEPGTRADETRLKRMFKVHLTHGNEWFAMVPSLTHHIAQVKAKHGEPDPSITFAAQPVTIPQRREPQYIGGKHRGNGQTGVMPTGLVC